jgi:hypothetical protein
MINRAMLGTFSEVARVDSMASALLTTASTADASRTSAPATVKFGCCCGNSSGRRVTAVT